MKKYLIKIIFLLFAAVFLAEFLPERLLFGAEKKGSLTGSVRYFGKTPPRESGPINNDREVCGSEYLEESLVNFENKGVKKAVISLKKKTNGLDPSVTEK